MRFKVIAFMLALTMMSWAQTATQSKPNPSTSQNATATAPADSKAECPCCQKAGEGKEPMSCCAAKDGEKTMSCCAGKDGKACMEGKEGKSCMKGDKSQVASCNGSECCGADHQKCSKLEKSGETAAACCGQCSKHKHDHDAAAGN